MPPTYQKLTVTHEQVSTLVGFMERHGDLSINPKEMRIKYLWSELIGILNQIGIGPRKSLDQWKKTWTDLKYRAKEKILKIQGASDSSRHNTELSELEKRIYGVLQNKQSHFDLDTDANDLFQRVDGQQECPETDGVDPVFIEFIDHTDSLSPVHKIENSPSPSPPPLTEIKRKRKRRYSSEGQIADEAHKRQNISPNSNLKNKIKLEEESQIQPQQLLELKRLELETLRETNLHERETIRAQLDRETLKVQQQLITFLEDIKPALIKFLNK